ncbi:MAG TPA: AAA family ATPase, partial [Candidatus Babeliaceae bacterium]|nr:AAA family ATPase [Candidatus Babeliaceae bacterium]
MFIQTLQLQHFRCFDQTLVHFSPITLIEGANGCGKSSLLESLHYACYLRSFRTPSPKDLISFGQPAFFMELSIQDNLDCNSEYSILCNTLQVGFSGKKRQVKIDGNPIASYKQIIEIYRIITVTEEDLSLVKGLPELRRRFLDQALLVAQPNYASLIRNYLAVLRQRNILLSSKI